MIGSRRGRRRGPNPVLMVGATALAARAGARAGTNAAMANQQQMQQPQVVQQPGTFTQPMQQTVSAAQTYPMIGAAGVAHPGAADAGVNAPAGTVGTAAYSPPTVTPMPPMMSAAPQGAAPQHTMYGQAAPPYYHTQPQAPRASGVPVVSIISPEDSKKIRKMQLVNFGCTMLQLACAVAIIGIVRNQLVGFITLPNPGGRGVLVEYRCLAATSAWPGTCEYAYALASTSIFFGFIISLMQCLTMDCCGMGRLLEAVFDCLMAVWWSAGTITLAVRADEANKFGLARRDARNAVVAMSAISALVFWALLVTNLVLIKRLGKAYKAAQIQMQQHATAYPTANQMATYQRQAAPPAGPDAAAGGSTPALTAVTKDLANAV